jgi:hypothetical protein
MAKKKVLILALVLAVVGGGGGVFAQFSIEGSASTNFTTAITPTIGIGIGLPSLDILAGVNLNIATSKYKDEDQPLNDYSGGTYSFGVYAGVAPIVSLTEEWTLSIPLLAQLTFSGTKERKWENPAATVIPGNTANAGSRTFALQFKAGARAAYAFSDHWSLYTGFLFDVVSWSQPRTRKWKTSDPKDGTEPISTATSTFTVLGNGVVQLGISYKF